MVYRKGMDSVTLSVAVVGGILAFLALTGALFAYLMLRRGQSPMVNLAVAHTDDDGNPRQWTATTPAGPAVITDCVTDEKGRCYEIETDFKGEPVRLYYFTRSLPLTVRFLGDLASASIAGRGTR